MEKKSSVSGEKQTTKKPSRKMSEYGRQLAEKQKIKQMYGMRERQFRKFFSMAVKTEGSSGENLLSLLERRLDNVLYRLKLSGTRAQARQIIVHGHVNVNDKRVYSPSFLVSINDVVTINPNIIETKKEFIETVIDKRLKTGIKVPEWLELDKKDRKGIVLRNPVRADIQAPIEEQLVVELYSK